MVLGAPVCDFGHLQVGSITDSTMKSLEMTHEMRWRRRRIVQWLVHEAAFSKATVGSLPMVLLSIGGQGDTAEECPVVPNL